MHGGAIETENLQKGLNVKKSDPWQCEGRLGKTGEEMAHSPKEEIWCGYTLLKFREHLCIVPVSYKNSKMQQACPAVLIKVMSFPHALSVLLHGDPSPRSFCY